MSFAIIQALLAKSNDYQDSSVMDLFFLLAKEYLKLSYSYTTSGRKNSFLFNTIKAVPSEALYVLRKLVWETIENTIQIENYKDSCLEILNDYKTNYWDDSLDVTVFDLRYIEQIICKLERSIDQCILANEFITRFRKTQYDFVVLNKIINARYNVKSGTLQQKASHVFLSGLFHRFIFLLILYILSAFLAKAFCQSA